MRGAAPRPSRLPFFGPRLAPTEEAPRRRRFSGTLGQIAVNVQAEGGHYTLVTVEVQGKDVPVGTVKVQVTARNSKRKIIAMNTADVSIYDRLNFEWTLLHFDDQVTPAMRIVQNWRWLIQRKALRISIRRTISL